MKLSTLINYRNELSKLDLSHLQKTLDDELKKVLFLADNQPVVVGNNSQLHAQQQQIHSAVDEFKNLMGLFSHEFDQIISELEKPYFLESYRLYDQEMNNETLEDIKNRATKPSESALNLYRSRISRYVGWQHSAMIVRPGVEPFVNEMVSCDPLYLVDLDHELLKVATEQYNELYQQRLRNYVVNERNQDPILTRLPDAQFGVILVYNYFNFRPFEVIRKWLAELIQKLKPGGTLIMTFNDCDRDKAVMLVENCYSCYTPGHLVKQLAETLGYQITFQWHDDGPSTWLELKRPGTLSTVRGGQTLAKVRHNPVAESK
jgi:SAM-dependent methyltransferase